MSDSLPGVYPMESEIPDVYGCSFGCGNQFTMVVTDVNDASTNMLCVPCFIKLAMQLVEAITEPDSPVVTAAVEDYVSSHPESAGKRGRKASLKGADGGAGDAVLFDEYEDDIEES